MQQCVIVSHVVLSQCGRNTTGVTYMQQCVINATGVTYMQQCDTLTRGVMSQCDINATQGGAGATGGPRVIMHSQCQRGVFTDC